MDNLIEYFGTLEAADKLDRGIAVVLVVDRQSDVRYFLRNCKGVDEEQKGRRKQHHPTGLRIARACQKLLHDQGVDALPHGLSRAGCV